MILTNIGSSGGSGTPGGSDTQLQFNDASAFGGDAGLVYNKTTNVLTNTGGGITIATGVVSVPFTASSTVGVVNAGGARFIHGYSNADFLANELDTLGYADAYNTFVGITAGNFTSSGGAGLPNGGRNIGVGFRALMANTTGWQNTAIGYISQMKGTTGQYNTAVGAYTLVENTTGSNNTAIGSDALWLTTTGGSNTAVGAYAGQQNTTANENTTVGKDSQRNGTTGGQNSSLGSEALLTNTTGVENTAIGWKTLRVLASTNFNTALGSSALKILTAGAENTAIGAYALPLATDTDRNVAVGFGAGEQVTTGDDNTLLGRNAGANLTTGSSNIIIGSGISADSVSASSQVSIGGLFKGVIGTSSAITAPLTITGIAGSSCLTLTGVTQTASNPVLNATQTWNSSGVTFTGWKLNVTDTASATASKLLDLQVGGVSQLNLTKVGALTVTQNVNAQSVIASTYLHARVGVSSASVSLTAPSDGVGTLGNWNADNFGRLQLGGTTSSFPAIKRSSAGIHFRLADDSAFAVITAKQLVTDAGTTALSSLSVPHGAAPTSPVDGDIWTTTAGLFVRINGSTVGPLS